ncbi:MAG: hypothetical protein QXD77_02420 [Candidatus Aenigmatarchaeota archaeon]
MKADFDIKHVMEFHEAMGKLYQKINAPPKPKEQRYRPFGVY